MRILWLSGGEHYQPRDLLYYHLVFEVDSLSNKILVTKNRLTSTLGWVTREEAEALTILATRSVN